MRKTRRALDDAALTAAAHVDIDRLETSLEDVIGACKSVCCSTVVVPSYDADAFTSRERICDVADHIAGLAATLDNHEEESLTVYTDGFRAYDPLEDDEKYEREAVIH